MPGAEVLPECLDLYFGGEVVPRKHYYIHANTLRSPFSWHAVVTCVGWDFMVVTKKSGRAHGGSKVSSAVAVVGSPEEERMYNYQLRLCGNHHRLTWEANVQGINSLAHCIKRGECLELDVSSAEHLRNGGDLIFELTIYTA
ncbi:hypothetical protein HPB52_017454 [Rhipicephalus sanguineus]|uniref:Seven-in-absentia protein TRAF-like domain-containing protein n=1 Tax=Rhipicephalus sanguineus TaxID=34632 RepID=A0A9D4PEV6_RHISA|nr:hypothetical protein HPB52_017454 [Rhipicephalus sanguineus]